jgi:hypothetical protein
MTTPPNFPDLDLPIDLDAIYANTVRIAHSPAELVLDFARTLPGTPGTKVCARLIMSPVGAKLFFRALGENLARYEASYGPIPVPGDPSLASDLFGNIHPPQA